MSKVEKGSMPRTVTLQELADLASGLPDCILVQCCEERVTNLKEFFWYKPAVRIFGEHLVRIAGLVVSALYLHAREHNRNFPRDQIFEDYLENTLFGRGYTRGLACALLQRSCLLRNGPFKAMIRDKSLVTRFIGSIPDRPSNFLREELRDPSESSLAHLIEELRFLKELHFGQNAMDISYLGNHLDLSPFLIWDGKVLRAFHTLTVKGRTDCDITLIDQCNPDLASPEPVSGVLLARISKVAGMLEVSSDVFDGGSSPEDEGKPSSIMSGLADTQPQLSQLAQMLLEKSEKRTKGRLWVPEHEREQADEILDGSNADVIVTNEIIRKCLAEDPVSVVEEYFQLEPKDPEEYFKELARDRQEAQVIRKKIRRALEQHNKRVSPFFCMIYHERKLSEHLREYESRLAAQQVVKLLGFPIVEINHEDDLISHVKRAIAFREFLDYPHVDHEQSKITAGLQACSNAAEHILGFLYLFYKSLPYYDSTEISGMTSEGYAAVEKVRKDITGRGLGALIGAFRGLNKDDEIKNAVFELVGRTGIWPEGTEDAPLSALNYLNTERIFMDHGRPPSSGKTPTQLVAGFQMFLDWLLDPTSAAGGTSCGGTGGSCTHRIYTAIVALNLQTKTRSGITSLRYKLKDIYSNNLEVTLYTTQPVSVESCYYGLPSSKTDRHDFWNNPVLIQTDVFSCAEDKERGTTNV